MGSKPQTLDSSRVVKALISAVSFVFSMIFAYIFLQNLHVSPNGFVLGDKDFVVGRDFLNFWVYGREALGPDPGRFYDLKQYNPFLDQLIGLDYPAQFWSYPPHTMLLAAPFGAMTYHSALLLFSLLGVLFLGMAARNDFSGAGDYALIFAAPALGLALLSGQFSIFIAAILITVFHQMDKRPLLSGALIALLTIKPQIGFLIPIFLMMTGRWKLFFAASFFTILFIGSSVLVFGVDVWETYLTETLGRQSTVPFDSHPFTGGLMPTVSFQFWRFGLEPHHAMTLHWTVAALALGFFVWMLRSGISDFAKYALLIITTFVVTPYYLSYDTVVLLWLLVVLIQYSPPGRVQWIIFALVAFLPFVGIILSSFFDLGSAFIVLALYAWIAVWTWRQRLGGVNTASA